MSVAMRQRVEKVIVRKLVADLLAAGYRLTVSLENGYDIEECLLGSTDRRKILEEAFAGDECHVFVHKDDKLIEGRSLNCIGWVKLVFGNDGWDVISDYTTNLEKYMDGASRLADKYAG